MVQNFCRKILFLFDAPVVPTFPQTTIVGAIAPVLSGSRHRGSLKRRRNRCAYP